MCYSSSVDVTVMKALAVVIINFYFQEFIISLWYSFVGWHARYILARSFFLIIYISKEILLPGFEDKQMFSAFELFYIIYAAIIRHDGVNVLSLLTLLVFILRLHQTCNIQIHLLFCCLVYMLVYGYLYVIQQIKLSFICFYQKLLLFTKKTVLFALPYVSTKRWY